MAWLGFAEHPLFLDSGQEAGEQLSCAALLLMLLVQVQGPE